MIRRRSRPADVRRSNQQQGQQSQDRFTDRHVTAEPYTPVDEHTFDHRGVADMAERDREIGRRTHALVAGFCRAHVVPEPTQVWVAAGRLFQAEPMVLNHSSRQRAACGVSTYFVRFHRTAWKFVGAEVSLGNGRVDLVWQLPSDRFVIDELKTSANGEALEDRVTLEQIERYRRAGQQQWGGAFAGVRLLPLVSPGRARFHPADAVPVSLQDAPEEVR